jgi:hypothetical protein
MTHRERVLRTFEFEPTDRVPFDLMEGCVWSELMDYFRAQHGLKEAPEVIEWLDPDFRWVWMSCEQPVSPPKENPPAPTSDPTYSREVATGPLAKARTVADV